MSYLLALAFGALIPLSLAPFGWWPLGLVAIGGWFWLLQRSSSRGWLLGWLFGFGKYIVGVSWVYVSIHLYGGAPPLLAGFLVLLFAGGLAVFPMLNAWLFQRLRSGFAPQFNAWLFVFLFVGFEWLLTWFLTGFPWLYPAYAHIDTALAGFAPIGGVLLVSFALVTSACFAVAGHLSQRKTALMIIAISPWVLGALLAQINWVMPAARHSVVLVQGNIDQAVKWLPDSRMPIIETYRALSEPYWGADLMIWPEAAITVMAHNADSVLEMLDERAEQAQTALVLGLPALERLPDGEIAFRNTAVGMGTAQGRYVKRRLVPFGEYVPLEGWLRGLIELFDLPMSHASPGARSQPLLRLAKGQRAAMAICYEIIYPGLVREQARRADVLITISNDSWFGASIGPLQHLQMAQMRALENGRWLLRDTNNGVTAIVDHRGEIVSQLPQFTADVLTGHYRQMLGNTPYSQFGEGPLLGVLGAGLLFGGWRRYRRGN
ncbi:MAG: apolipoprotein N-acyltransferase [Pseudomonadales bacterium]|jgi:apolipoprotein N-acyltransferase